MSFIFFGIGAGILLVPVIAFGGVALSGRLHGRAALVPAGLAAVGFVFISASIVRDDLKPIAVLYVLTFLPIAYLPMLVPRIGLAPGLRSPRNSWLVDGPQANPARTGPRPTHADAPP
jgi:hypothetical protein